MKRKTNFLENFHVFSVGDSQHHEFLEEELRDFFGVYGFETSFRFLDSYDY